MKLPLETSIAKWRGVFLATGVVIAIIFQIVLLTGVRTTEVEIEDMIFRPVIDEDEDTTKFLPARHLTSTRIRQCGCARNETPFVFVHIGKAGGGGVRARLAASALSYNRSAWHAADKDTDYYYPIYDHGTMHRGGFFNSKMNNFVPPTLEELHSDFLFEGILNCTAKTALGQALACPRQLLPLSGVCNEYVEENDNNNNELPIRNHRCDAVYVGHNLLGTELHWLPTGLLIDWWKTTPFYRHGDGDDADDAIVQALHLLRYASITTDKKGHLLGLPQHAQVNTTKLLELPQFSNGNLQVQCPNPGPYTTGRDIRSNYQRCFQNKDAFMDEMVQQVVAWNDNGDDNIGGTRSGSAVSSAHIMAWLPTLRVTILREPFSWLTSKFFWHESQYSRNKEVVVPWTGNYVAPWKSTLQNQKRNYFDKEKNETTPRSIQCDDLEELAYGWGHLQALKYMAYLCGEHCLAGLADHSMTLEDMEQQAAYNLRNSFAVVGLLHKTDDFYRMVKDRVYYMDTSLNLHVTGKEHSSGKFEEARLCKKLFKDPNFQKKVADMSPAIAALVRLYKIAEEVNAFQEEELRQCTYSERVSE